MLSNRQQVARLRHLAIRALGEYPLVAPELRFVAHGENTTFRVDAMTVDGRDRFLLRVHRPARHGQRLDSATAVGSELDWLTALRADTALSVPEPFRTTDGRLITTAAFKDVPEPRVCSMLRWMDGRVHAAVPRPVHLRRLGSVMARLHNSSQPARSHSACGLPAPRRSTPPSVPTFPRCWGTSATRWTPFSQARAPPEPALAFMRATGAAQARCPTRPGPHARDLRPACQPPSALTTARRPYWTGNEFCVEAGPVNPPGQHSKASDS